MKSLPAAVDAVAVNSEDDATAYADETGHRPDPVASDFFRLAWDLNDLAAYVQVLRSPHVEEEDTLQALDGLQRSVAIRDQWAGTDGSGRPARRGRP
jgi:hypothetical protein